MDFKKLNSKTILISSLLFFVAVCAVLWKCFGGTSEIEPLKEPLAKPSVANPPTVIESSERLETDVSKSDDAVIQQQLDRDRQEQRQTKYLKIRLEQTNLELEEEKALAEINKLKLENMGTFKEPGIDGQKTLPEVRVEYIGGDSIKKEAILSIGGVTFQVKEKSSPLDNIQVLSISDSSVTVHFSAPVDLTKIIDYKPE